MELLKEGKKAPAFTLQNKDGEKVKLNEIDSDFTVLYFYPKDDTPGCTIQANEFTADVKKFEKINTKVIGISGGDEKTKTKFCKKYDLKVTLLSDTDFAVAEKYGVFGEKQFMGKKYMGISRVTYVLDANKKIIKVYPKAKTTGHSAEVYEFIKSS
jgi:peroxiredoxin Q/BCP